MEQYETQIRELVPQGITHSNISDMLQHANPNVRGFSERSVRRLCQQHDISYTSNLTDIELSDTVHGAAQHLGHSYGRWMMHGVLAACDIHVSQPALLLLCIMLHQTSTLLEGMESLRDITLLLTEHHIVAKNYTVIRMRN